MKYPFSFIILVGFFFGCSSAEKSGPQKVDLPNTPEEVVKDYVIAFYNDDFEKAIMLGTEVTHMMIDSVKKEIQLDAPIVPFEILKIKCEEKSDSAICTYIYREEGEDFDEVKNLIKVNDQWLVDDPWDDSLLEADLDLEMLKEEVERIIEEDIQ